MHLTMNILLESSGSNIILPKLSEILYQTNSKKLENSILKFFVVLTNNSGMDYIVSHIRTRHSQVN
ncbi:hypothetical protein HK099_006316 [Clydaea vesicula]|uniref:Uncharacterized protein n=1 Tax=Clydaea vesicula TaxID=447962 RepID=A0AAD5TXR1_9FUNG|nr:hypothetical protein HK099_006316 [Clydaea vesicula]